MRALLLIVAIGLCGCDAGYKPLVSEQKRLIAAQKEQIEAYKRLGRGLAMNCYLEGIIVGVKSGRGETNASASIPEMEKFIAGQFEGL